MVEERVGHDLDWEYLDQNREGDHICYISDLRRLRADYPSWRLSASLDEILDESVGAQLALSQMTSVR